MINIIPVWHNYTSSTWYKINFGYRQDALLKKREEFKSSMLAAHLVALGKHRVLVDIADKIGNRCPDAKAHTKDQEVACNEGIERECACPPANPPAPGFEALLYLSPQPVSIVSFSMPDSIVAASGNQSCGACCSEH